MINICLKENLKNALNENEINVKDYLPAYNGESAGLDLFNAGNTIAIMPESNKIDNSKTLISTGLCIAVPKGWVALIRERGSITKTPLKLRAGVIDSGYTGEIFVNLVNLGQNEFRINKSEKLPVQLVIVKCDNEFNSVSQEEYEILTNKSKRKIGMIGSSD